MVHGNADSDAMKDLGKPVPENGAPGLMSRDWKRVRSRDRSARSVMRGQRRTYRLPAALDSVLSTSIVTWLFAHGVMPLYTPLSGSWLNMAESDDVDARLATVEDVKRYREDLVRLGRQPSTIAQKLNVLRRVYAAVVAAGLRADNPATGIRAPRNGWAREVFGYLSEVELTLLFRAVPHGDELKHMRDRRCSVSSVCRRCAPSRSRAPTLATSKQCHGDSWAMLVHGKYNARLVFLRPDIAEALRAYLAAPPDELGEALIVPDGNFAGGRRWPHTERPGRPRPALGLERQRARHGGFHQLGRQVPTASVRW